MESSELTMKTTCEDMSLLPETALAGVVGGAETFARDAGQFAGGALGYVRDHPIVFSTASMILPPAGFLLAIAAGLAEAVER